MILLIDNYDSFSYNLYQLTGEINPDITVIRNDELTVEQIRNLHPERIIISPGPGRPENAGVIINVVKTLGKEIPVLGVCLGHQAVCAAYGATVTYAKKLMHGKQSAVKSTGSVRCFTGAAKSNLWRDTTRLRRTRTPFPNVLKSPRLRTTARLWLCNIKNIPFSACSSTPNPYSPRTESVCSKTL